MLATDINGESRGRIDDGDRDAAPTPTPINVTLDGGAPVPQESSRRWTFTAAATGGETAEPAVQFSRMSWDFGDDSDEVDDVSGNITTHVYTDQRDHGRDGDRSTQPTVERASAATEIIVTGLP